MTEPLLTDEDRDALRDWWDEGETASVESAFPFIARIVERVAAEAWDRGMRTGTSRAMRMMSDEPGLPLALDADNPYTPDTTGGAA